MVLIYDAGKKNELAASRLYSEPWPNGHIPRAHTTL